MVNDTAFIFHKCIHCGKNFPSVPRSRSSITVNVKYEGPNFQKMAIAWGIRETHLFLSLSFFVDLGQPKSRNM